MENNISSTATSCKEGSPQQQQHNEKQQLRFGWRSFRPDCLQRFNNSFFFMVCLCTMIFGQGLACTGIANTVITSVEKRYGFTSTQLGFMKTCFHITVGAFNGIVCYFGHRHRPFTLVIGCLLISLGNFIVTISHYISPPYQAGVTLPTDTCRLNGTDSSSLQCLESNEVAKEHMAIFVIGYVIIGLGVTPLYSLGYAHLDDVTPRGKNSLYFGITGTVVVIGPAAGFLLANPLLKVYVDVKQPAGSHLTPQSENWIGAWWIGFLVGAGLLLIPAISMLGFPPLFPNSEVLKNNKKVLKDTIDENKDLKYDFKSMWPATKALLKNTPFIFTCFADASEGLLVGGITVFLPKFLETQFRLTAARSALYTGFILIPGAACGMFIGGLIVKRLDWNCKQTLRGATIIAALSLILCPSILVGCGSRDVIGVDSPYHNSSNIDFVNECNVNCHCSRQHYKPVCSVDDQKTFFSSCHAGCKDENMIDDIFYITDPSSTKEYPFEVKQKGDQSNFRRACKKFSIENGQFFYNDRVVIIDEERQNEIIKDEGLGKSNQSKAKVSTPKKYFNCTCLPIGSRGHVKDGGCEPECKLLPLAFVLLVLLNFGTTLIYVPMLNVVFRTVPEGQGSFAMGFQQVFSRFLGAVPAPMLFGRLIDESCKLWNIDECTGKASSCLEYNNSYFRYYLFALCAAAKFLTVMFLFGSYKTYHLPVEHNLNKSDLEDTKTDLLTEQSEELLNEKEEQISTL